MAPQPPADGDYDAICATIRGSAQGRWFLDEYARRTRNIDTELVLAAIGRIEAAVRREYGPPANRNLRADLLDMAKAIAQTRAEPGADSPEADRHGKVGAGPASSTVLAAAERIQDVAWTMRERGLDPRICEQIEALAASILSSSPLRNGDDHRANKLTEVLQYLERRIDALLAGCAGAPASVPEPPTADAAPAEVPAAAPPEPSAAGPPDLSAAVPLPLSGEVASDEPSIAVQDESPPAPAATAAPTEAPVADAPAPPGERPAPDPIVSDLGELEAILAAHKHDLEAAAAAIAPAPEVARQRSAPTPLPAVEFWSAPEPSEPPAAPTSPAAAASPVPQPQSQPAPATAMEAAALDIDPLVVIPVKPLEPATDAPRPQLELDPIAVEPLFPPAASAATPEIGPATPPAIEAPAEPALAPAAAAPAPAFRPPEVAMVFLVEDEAAPRPQSEAPATLFRNGQVRSDLGAHSEPPGAADITEVPLEPLSLASEPPAPAVPAATPLRPPTDSLLALKAMSDEERIALFT